MMYKIVFINPAVDKYAKIKIWSSDIMNTIRGKRVSVMPKVVPMLLAALTPSHYEFVHVDEEIEDVDFDIEADIIALTAMTVQIERAYEIADAFRARGKTVMIGGIHATVLPDEAAEHCDVVAIGEGENIWPVILEDFENNRLKGRYYAKDYPPVLQLSSPRVDIIKHDHYSLFPLMATKGCPYDCDFCSVSFVNGRRIRLKPVEQIVEEIRAFEKYSRGLLKKNYQFVDDNLYVNREYTKELFRAIKPLGITWHGQGTLNTANDDEILQIMAESGCRIFSIGFESISEASLREANKARVNQVAAYEKAVQNIIRHGMIPGGFFIFGFDSDDQNIFDDTFEFILEKHIVNPTFCILTPYPGTKLAKRLEERVFDWSWRKYGVVQCVFEPENMSPEELERNFYRLAKRMANLDVIKKQLLYFWNQGPWKTNPPLNLIERAGLMLIGLKLRKNDKDLMKFAFWAARQKNAVDLFIIMTAIVFNDMTKDYPD
jgi:radical SAM superfamily enzyme YgiQ (UPF0313 family)